MHEGVLLNATSQGLYNNVSEEQIQEDLQRC